MTYSVLMPFLQGLCDNSLCHLEFRIEANHLVPRIAGRAYFNVNLSLALLKLLPGTAPNEVGAIFGGAQEHAGWRQKIQLDTDDVPKLRFHPCFVVRHLPGVLVMMTRFYLLKNPLSNVTPPRGLPASGLKNNRSLFE